VSDSGWKREGEGLMRSSSQKLTKEIKVLLAQKMPDEREAVRADRIAQQETGTDLFVKAVIDRKLTPEENAVLVRKLREMREAFIAMLLSNRGASHSKDFVSG
jgi:hypothetical protein